MAASGHGLRRERISLIHMFFFYHNDQIYMMPESSEKGELRLYHNGFGTRKNGQLEIWYSSSPLGPWKPHKNSPFRDEGRPFLYDGNRYCMGQDYGETYRHLLGAFKVEILTKDQYKEDEVSLCTNETLKKYVRIDDSAAWPVASSVVTCASVSEADFPVNFVADPFLYVQLPVINGLRQFQWTWS